MEQWRTYTLEELTIGKGTYGIGASAVPYDSSKYTYLRITDINDDGTLNKNELKSVDDVDADKYVLQVNDIVFARTGNSTGRSYFYDGSDGVLVYAGFLIKFSLDPAKVNPRIMKYYTHSQEYYDWVKSFDTGGTRGNINAKTYGSMPITLPPRDIQDKIVEVLKSLDEKIELNKRINDNLEQQIQTLYREWFIDNPKTEWATMALSEVATFVGGYSYKGNELVDSSETAMATIKNFERNGGFKLDGYKPVSPSSKLKEEQHAELFDILIAHTDLTQNAEVIGNAEIILSKDSYSDVIFSMDLVKVVAKESFPYQFLLALLLKNPVFKSHCIGYVNGTTVLHLNKRALPDFNTQIPTCEDAARMNEIAKSIFTKMSENLSEIANLTKLRDSLLPKLMSGELKINEIDC